MTKKKKSMFLSQTQNERNSKGIPSEFITASPKSMLVRGSRIGPHAVKRVKNYADLLQPDVFMSTSSREYLCPCNPSELLI